MNTADINISIISQMKASLSMLKNCIQLCPDSEWEKDHNDYPFCQIVFHTLFDCDYSLCDYESELKDQDIHIKYAQIFGDYRELIEQIPTKMADKAFIKEYFMHCYSKTELKINDKSLEDLIIRNADVTKSMTKLERYINSIRHIQHHSAQLGLQLQYLSGHEMEWIGKKE